MGSTTRAGLVGLAVCLLLGATGFEASRATAAPADGSIVLLVNSADFGGPDTSPGDGICDAGGTVTIDGADVPRCTLRAAIEEANAYAAATGATNGGEIVITLDPGFTGGTIIGANTPDVMQTTPASNLVAGPVWFVVTAPMTIDLQNRLGTGGAGFTSTVFAITGSNVTVNNASSILGGDTSFVIGGAANNVTIDGGQTYQSVNNFAQRFMLVNNGANGVTLRNYKVGGLQPSSTQPTDARGALVFAPNAQATAITKNVLVDGVDFTSPQVTATGAPSTICTASDGSGCVNTGVNMSTGANVNGFEMRNSSANNIKSPSGSYVRPFTAWNLAPGGSLANLNLHDNTFNNNLVAALSNLQYGVVTLPNGLPLGGKNAITGNTFDNSKATTQGFGISWMPNLASTTASGLVISDNYFDGFSVASIMLYSAGLVTMERNLFGVHSASQSNTGNEVSAAGGVMIANAGTTTAHTNNASTTWWPMVPTIDASCQATFRLQPTSPTPTNMTQPATPVRVDVYWTSYLTAEKFIGSTTMLTGPTTVTMPLPPETILSGATTGYIRVQTQSMGPSGMPYGQMQSSQFSGTQTIPLTACTPPTTAVDGDLTIDKRGWLNADGLTYAQIVGGSTAAVEVPSGARLPAGTKVWWTYTVVYTGQPGLKGVVVTDSVLGPVCTVDVPSNTPTGCLASGQVTS